MRFEYPFNERVRNILRLEYLLERMHLLAHQSDPRIHQLALGTLFDVLEITDRADVKSALSQDLMRQRQALSVFAQHPQANNATIEQLMNEIDRNLDAVNNLGRIGQSIRDNDWLVAIRGRLSVAGGAAQIDSPSLLAWQKRPESQRYGDLQDMMASVEPLRSAINLTLRLLRQSSEPEQALAQSGAFQRSLEGKACHMMQVWIDADQHVYPEMSGNKYMIWVRFSRLDENLKTHTANQDVPFKYALCGL